MVSVARRIGFYAAFIIPGLVVTGFYLGGLWNYLALIFAFVILPVLDQLIGTDPANIPDDEMNHVEEEFYYRFVIYLWTYLQLAMIIWGAYVVTTGRMSTVWEWIGFVVSFSLLTGGIGITVAHELGHKKSAVERLYARLLLMTVCYMHFTIEHNRGHHVSVATPEDPATARRDQNFFSFWTRSVFVGYVHAWKLEKERLRKKGLSPLSAKNEMFWCAIFPLLLCASLTLLFSRNGEYWQIPLFFFSQSVLAFTLLELVNYVEHYGILRRETSPGKYEKVNPLHSWNSSHLLSNFFLFQLQRHSDHHVYAHKRYQVLDHHEESPQLPFGYSTMIILALVPPLWYGVMNRRLEAWLSKDVKA
ncbi:MAG TPA: alkane 1-monooxygenase [Chryseolinea sp.]|nr:alkane 1-monooxygenase [Chryseolinea sp.]